MKYIILINGLKRSGKDFITDIMIKNNADIKKLSFAEPIKDIIANTFEISKEQLDDFKNDEEGYGIELKAYPNNQPIVTIDQMNFREILQNFGTEGMKPIFGENVWADITIQKALENDITVIPDFRFNIEYETALKTEAKVITVRIYDDNVKDEDFHSSETELKNNGFKFDYHLDNTGHPDLTKEIKFILSKLT